MKKYKPFVFLFLFLILSYWQISFLSYSLKWDTIDVVFPFRYHFSECIQSGYFPFWNPYQQTGVPFYADLQAPTYYPELLFTSLFSGYGVYTMHFLFVFYIIISATGVYKLSFYFNKNINASLIAGIAYSLSGYIIGHGQHFFLLVGMAWIPFVILYYLKLLDEKKLIDVLKTGIFIFLMISGSYQALSFVLLYLLLAFFIFYNLKAIKNKDFKTVFYLLKLNIYLLFIVVIFSVPLIISTVEVMSSVNRLNEGISLEKALSNGLSPKSILSFFVPFSTVKNPDFFGSDVSMRNFYIGIIPLIFLIPALLKKRSVIEYILLGIGIIILTSAFSNFLPVREFLFNNVPLMNLYKYSPFVRIFGLLALIIISTNYIAEFNMKFEKEKMKVIFSAFIVLLILTGLFIFSSNKIDFANLSFLKEHKNFEYLLKNISFHEHIFIQTTFQIIITAIFIFIVFKFKKIKYAFYLITVLFAFEIFVSAQLNMFYTVVSSEFNPVKMKKDLSLNPSGFPVPIDDKIKFNNKKHTAFFPFWRNTYIFSKQISFESFSSFDLDSYSKLDDENLNLKNTVLNNHLCYFSDKILPMSSFSNSALNPIKDSKILFFEDSVYAELSKYKVSVNGDLEYKIKEFTPNKIIIETAAENSSYFTIIQSNYKGWKAFIDNSETKIYSSNFNYRTILLPKGKHTIKYEYKNNKILITYILSNLLFLVSVLFLISYIIYKKNDLKLASIIISSFILIIFSILLLLRLTSENKNEHTNTKIDKNFEKYNPAIHIYEDFENLNDKFDTLIVISGKKSLKIDSANVYPLTFELNTGNKKIKQGTLRLSGFIFPKDYRESCIVTEISRNNKNIEWHCTRIEKQIEKINKRNKINYLKNFYDLEENDLIKIYFWNPNKSNFCLDSLNIDFYKF